MVSQKKARLKHCIKCGVTLTKENWPKCLWNRSNYICKPCFQAYGKTYYKTDPEYGKKQSARYHRRRSAVIHAYGDVCAKCGEDEYTKLTIDHVKNNGAKHRKEVPHTVDYLYNRPVDKNNFQILCYNCNCSKGVIYKDKYALRDKKIVMEAYGNQCATCGEDRIECLTMDHKNNDGAIQRRQYRYTTGSRFYRWLIKNGFPDNLGLQVLCFNCNCSKLYLAKHPPEAPKQVG